MNQVIRIVFCFLIFFQFHFLIAQNVEGGDITRTTPPRPPEAYSNPKGIIEKKKTPRKKTGDGIWYIYSDRENNQTYSDKACQARPLNKISINQVFIVADETDDALRIVLYNLSDKVYEEKKGGGIKFKPSAEDYGWIKKTNMLLWDRGLEDKTTGYAKKAVAVTKMEEAVNITSKIKRGLLELYEAPKAEESLRSSKDIKLFQYLFVYKEEGEMVLLGTNNYFSRNSISYDLLGWARKSSLHIWNSAICLRINFDAEAEAERDASKVEVRFFRTKQQALDYKAGKAGTSNLPFKFSDPTDGPSNDNPYYYGFPILDEETVKDGIYNTGYVTNTIGKNGENIFSSEKQAQLNRIWQEIQSQRDNINIIFVADGSLKSYFKTFASALDANATIGSARATKNDYKMGAVIYYDNDCGDQPLEIKALTSDKDRLITWLNDESQVPPPCTLNRDAKGAPIFDALSKACSMFENAKSTNVIIFLGAASTLNKENKEKVVEALSKKQTYLYCFQAANKDGRVYDDYFRDCKDLLIKSSESIENAYSKAGTAKTNFAKLVEKGDNYELTNTAIPGILFSKDKGSTFAPADVTSRIKSLLTSIEKRVTLLLNQYESRTVGTGSVSDVDEGVKKEFELLWQGRGLKVDDLDKLSNQENFQLFIEAFSSVTYGNLKFPILNHVLFLSDKEFNRLEDAFEKLNQSDLSSSQRENLVSTFKQIITNYKGGNVDMTTLGNKKLGEFMTMLTGVNYTTKLFQRNLEDLNDERKTTPTEIDKLKNQFYSISKKLADIKKSKKHKFEQDDSTFFWIPESIFEIEN